MEYPVYKIDGTKTSKKVKLDEYYFGIESSDSSIYYSVLAEQAHKRQGTHCTKNRSAVSGGGRKPFRQKGTGRARQGTSSSGLLRGGGRIFGPTPHEYKYKVSKKVRDLAKRSSLSYKAKEEKIIIVEDFDFDEPKTKNMANILQALELNKEKTLLLTLETSKSLLKSCGNIVKLQVKEFSSASTYDILNSSLLMIQEGVIKSLKKVKTENE
ncbi:50S ribosomal protein L4 [candidate division KSB1 bacterium]